VLAEKPLAEDESTTHTLLGLAAMHKRLLCPVHQVLYQRGVGRALATLDRVQPLHCDLTMCSAGAEGRIDGDDDLVAEILPHPLSFLVRALPDAARSTQWSVASAAAGELRGTLHWSNGTASILISSHSRPTVSGARITGARGTIHFDFFHGFAVTQDPAVSRTRKALQPFLYSARLAVAATGNLAARAVRGQSAYPGLWELVAAFYRAIEHDLASPIAAAETIQVAALRDLILSRPPLEMRRRGFTSVHASTSMQER
jgi:predicted dehydrogenase